MKCDGVLSEVRIDTIRIDQCNACRGIWFDRKELEAVVDVARRKMLPLPATSSPVSQRMDERQGNCPRDRIALEPVESLAVDGLTYDHCPRCKGVWLDGGELEQIAKDEDSAAIMGFFTDS